MAQKSNLSQRIHVNERVKQALSQFLNEDSNESPSPEKLSALLVQAGLPRAAKRAQDYANTLLDRPESIILVKETKVVVNEVKSSSKSKNEFEELKNDLAIAYAQLDIAKSMNEKFKEQSKRMTILEDEKREIESKFATKLSQSKEKDEEFNFLKRSFIEAGVYIRLLEEKIEKLEERLKRLQFLDAQEQKRTDMTTIRLQDSIKTVALLQAEKEKSESRINGLEKVLFAERKQMKDEVEAKIKTLRMERDSYEAMANEWRSTAETRQKEIESITMSSTRRKHEFEGRVALLEKEFKEMYTEFMELDKENQKWEKENKVLKQTLDKTRTTMNDLMEFKTRALPILRKRRRERKKVKLAQSRTNRA